MSIRQPIHRELEAAIHAAARLNRVAGRFEVYDYLKAVYHAYRKGRYRKIAKRSARLLAGELSITRRKGTSSIRVLIEATMPGADPRQKSRWVRALEFISSEEIPTREFRKFVRINGGWAGLPHAPLTSLPHGCPHHSNLQGALCT